jgi:NAD(P)-dependent dehydrogenase (short-subunit alcohol dehydrogenase family)
MTARCALVTGGGRGIGRAIVVALAKASWDVTFSYRGNLTAASETIQLTQTAGRPARAIQADTACASERDLLIKAALAQSGRIDMLVNNAGMAPRLRTDLLEMNEESYSEVMDTNLKGPFFLAQRVALTMIDQIHTNPTPTPMIVNIGSISAYTSSTHRGEYCLSKAGMAMMTSLFADRLAEYGILVYEIRPGIIATDMTSAVKEKYDRLIAEGLLPIRKWGQPEDVARAVLALAEGYLSYSTGEVINVDGGFHLRRL